jgi:ComF family protein
MRNRLISTLHRFANPIVKAVVEALFPTKCLVCGSFIAATAYGDRNNLILANPTIRRNTQVDSHRLLASYCCANCAKTFTTITPPMCNQCGIMFKSHQAQNHLCGACIAQPKKFGKARASVVYDKELIAVLHRFKYAGKIQLARPLGGLLLATYTQFWNKEAIDVMIPVPLHTTKFRRRGFNQSILLIYSWKYMASAMNIKFPDVPIDRDVLVRNRPTAPQTGLGRQQRLKNIQDAFSVFQPERIQEKKIVLVDDVYTTGATVNECTHTLLQAGASQVDVLTLARAI